MIYSLCEARSFSKTFTRSQAIEPGIVVELCQSDMMVVNLPGQVKSVGLSLPDHVEARRAGKRVILMGKIQQGKTPLIIFMDDSDDLYRLHLDGCPTRGSTTMIHIVDDKKTKIDRTKTVAINQKQVTTDVLSLLKETVTLPAPTSVHLQITRVSDGALITIKNDTSQTLQAKGMHLKLFSGKEKLQFQKPKTQSIKAGMTQKFKIALPKEKVKDGLNVEWLITAPAIKAAFTLKSHLAGSIQAK